MGPNRRASASEDSVSPTTGGVLQRRRIAMEGFVFIQAQIGCAEEAARRVATLEGILSLEVVTGPYDIVARARRDCEHGLVSCLEEEIEALTGITRVLVCPLASHARI